jgi:hypothetical protein
MDESTQKATDALRLSPSAPITALPVMVQAVRLTGDGFLEFFWPSAQGDDPEHPLGPGIGRFMPPEELYLRELMDLDLDDTQAIVEFTRRYGRFEQERWELLPQWYTRNWRQRGEALELERIDELFASYRGSGREHVGSASHPEVFRLYARILRDAIRLWTEAAMTGSIDRALGAWESSLPKPPDSIPTREAVGLGPGDDEVFARHRAAEFLVNLLNDALTPYHPRLELNVPGVAWQIGVPAPGLYSAMVLQLYNHIAEEAQYRRCENCDRIFVRQRDRAEQGRYRTEGLRYCSKRCAWAAGQRKWRENQRKRKSAAELHAQGMSAHQIAEQLDVDVATLAEWLLESGPDGKG